MVILNIEDRLVELLAPLADAEFLEVMPMPESEAEYRQPVRSRISIAFSGTKFDPSEQLGGVLMQKNDMIFDISIQAKKLRDSWGIYQIYDAIWIKIFGKKIRYARKLYFVDFTFDRRENGYFTYVLRIAIPFQTVEAGDNDAVQPITGISLV